MSDLTEAVDVPGFAAASPSPAADGQPGADRPEPATVAETIITTLGGAAIGGAAIWLLAPICFVC